MGKKITRITEMYAYVTVDPNDGTEGIISAQMGATHMPLVGADTDRAESLRPIAQQIANAAGLDVELVRFTVRESIDTLPAQR